MIPKKSHLRRPRKKRLETSSDSEKDLVDDKSGGSLNLGNSDHETQT